MIECSNCQNANKYGDYEGPACEACGGSGEQRCEAKGCKEAAILFDENGRALCEDCLSESIDSQLEKIDESIADGWMADGSWKQGG